VNSFVLCHCVKPEFNVYLLWCGFDGNMVCLYTPNGHHCAIITVVGLTTGSSHLFIDLSVFTVRLLTRE